MGDALARLGICVGNNYKILALLVLELMLGIIY